MANVDMEPNADIEFESHEAAYGFYKEYAKSMGFGTAKLSSRRSRASKEYIDAKFSCIRYGNKQHSDDAVNPRPSPKIGCKASLHVKRKPDGKWHVYNFVKEHNHDLIPERIHLFRSHRDGDTLKNDSRTRRQKVLAVPSKQFSSCENINCLESYVRTQREKGRKLSLEAGDPQILLELFMNMQEEDPRFFYAVDLNEEHCLRNAFWVDAKGMDDYTKFGDVLSFETSYFTNKYKLPLVLFIGVNHHIQPILLGCALIGDGTVYTYIWLLKTWLMAMGGQAPRVILTDQNNALKAAISAVLLGTRHCLSLWHVLEVIPLRLEYMSLWLDGLMEKFHKCVFRSWTEEEFTNRWLKLIEKFKLDEDEWMRSLYEDRFLWVPVFLRSVSFAGLSTPSRAESLNSLFDKYINAETSIGDFVQLYKVLQEDKLEQEAKSQFDAWHEEPELMSPSPFEKQMSLVYTHEIFKKFQVEVLGAAACHLKKNKEEGPIITYDVKDFEVDQDFLVQWNESASEICCSCCFFEYRGYLCRHAIVVLQMSGVFSIPLKYVLQRWTNVALSRHGIIENLDDVQAKVRRYNDLCRRAIILGEEGSLSEDSYNHAVSAIKAALKQCAMVNNPAENVSKSMTYSVQTTNGNVNREERHDGDSTSNSLGPAPPVNKRSKARK
ncbi:Protein FAR1-RELATED SEQUENCE 4 [Dionaea muscipula]